METESTQRLVREAYDRLLPRVPEGYTLNLLSVCSYGIGFGASVVPDGYTNWSCDLYHDGGITCGEFADTPEKAMDLALVKVELKAKESRDRADFEAWKAAHK